MATNPSDSPTSDQTAEPGGPGSSNAQDTVSALSTDELSRPSAVVSSRLARSFAGKTDYEGEQALDAAIEEAKRALPQTPGAYKATGKTTVLAVLLMLIGTPIVLVALLGICGALCWGWVQLHPVLPSDPSYGGSRIAGLLSLFLNLILVVLMVAVPMFSFGLLSKWTKNRNPILPAILAGIVDFVVAVALFVPVWKGETLAPTHLTFLFIPIRWVLIAIGGILAPLLGAAVVHGKVSGQKFCEETGCFLKKFGEAKLPFDFGENVLALLQRGQYAAALRLPRIPQAQEKLKHWAAISLWWKQGAATAFLELNVRFCGKFKSRNKPTTQEAKEKNKEWLAFSVQIDRARAEILAQDFLRGAQ